MSHVMCHMSHVTCHMLRVTCHMSHVMCHMSQFLLLCGQSGETYWWRVCYQQGLLRLVFTFILVSTFALLYIFFLVAPIFNISSLVQWFFKDFYRFLHNITFWHYLLYLFNQCSLSLTIFYMFFLK